MPNELQTCIAEIWIQHLGTKTIAPDDNFFALGGHSLLGVKVISAIQDRFGLGDELKVADLLEFPTLSAFATHVETLTAPSEETGEI